jgi:hypothetical protein
MSSALAIAAVTASLKDLLNDGLLDHDLSHIGSFSVTAQPPDRITTGETENNQLNLFLYQVTTNIGWRNMNLPSRAPDGTRTANSPLALDLHYLLTAYGAKDLNSEVLLGYAMQLLHENPILSRAQLRTALRAPDPPVDGTLLPGPFGALSALDLADQAELLKISPNYLTSEDLSKLWTSMQARYRPSMAYTVSVVLIQSTEPGKSAPPVLKRGPNDRGPAAGAAPFPALAGVRPALSELLPAARLGDDLVVSGANLAGASGLTLSCDRLTIEQSLPVAAGAKPGELSAHLPAPAEAAAAMSDWGVGVYSAALRVERPNQPTWITNGAPLAISPAITVTPLNAATGTVQLTVTCTPRLRPIQEPGARLLFGDQELAPVSVDTPADATQPSTLTFNRTGVAAGTYVVRLRVDGIDSLPVTITRDPPAFDFDPQQTVTVA